MLSRLAHVARPAGLYLCYFLRGSASNDSLSLVFKSFINAIKIGLAQRNRLAFSHNVTVTKTFDVDKDAYFRAIDVALSVVSEKKLNSLSFGSQALSEVLAWVWDSSGIDAKLESLQIMDAPMQQLALTLIIGRTQNGRPVDHQRRDDIEQHYGVVFRKLAGVGHGN